MCALNPASSPRRVGGVALLVVLWLLVAMASVAGAIAWWTRERVADAMTGSDALDDRIAAVSTRDTLLFLAASVPMTTAGLPLEPLPASEIAERRLDEFGVFDKSPRGGELRLDGRPYVGIGSTVFAIQDEAGLVPIAQAVNTPVVAMLEEIGVDAASARRIGEALADYVDPDDQRRFRGAEERHYVEAGLGAPPNRPLLSIAELHRVMGFDTLSRDQQQRAVHYSTTAESTALNLNTAPATLVRSISNGCADRCIREIEGRHLRPFINGADFEDRTGTSLVGDRGADYRFAPSLAFRLTLQGRTGVATRIHVRLTPLAAGEGPWRVDATGASPRIRDNEITASPVPSPLFSTSAMAAQ